MNSFLMVAGAFSVAAPPATADQVLGEFLRAACLSDVDRVEAIRRIAGPTWLAGTARIERNITWSVDASTPQHDKIEQSWSIPLQGGRAFINVWKFDYAQPERGDYSSAMIWLRPDTLVDAISVAGTIGLTLRASGPVHRTPAQMTVISGDRIARTSAPTGWLQHYSIESAAADFPVEVTAMREWGQGHAEQVWRIGCHPRSR